MCQDPIERVAVRLLRPQGEQRLAINRLNPPELPVTASVPLLENPAQPSRHTSPDEHRSLGSSHPSGVVRLCAAVPVVAISHLRSSAA